MTETRATGTRARSRERAVRFKEDGDSKVMIGVAVCKGPKTYRLLLTHPHQAEGRIADIPCDDIESIDPVEPSPRGARPSIVDVEDAEASGDVGVHADVRAQPSSK